MKFYWYLLISYRRRNLFFNNFSGLPNWKVENAIHNQLSKWLVETLKNEQFSMFIVFYEKNLNKTES